MSDFALLHQTLIEFGISATQPMVQIFVPGRIEVIGKHVDYAGGSSLTCAIDKGFRMVVAPYQQPEIVLLDLGRNERIVFPTHLESASDLSGWHRFVYAVLHRLHLNFGTLNGCVIAFTSDLPPAAGISSSSAFVVALLMAIKAVTPLEYHPLWRAHIHSAEDFAAYAATLENGKSFGALQGTGGIGVLGGTQDQTAICCAIKDHLNHYGYLPTRHLGTIPFPESHCFVIGNSGVHADKADGAKAAYNAASQSVQTLTEMGQFLYGEELQTLQEVVTAPQYNRQDWLARLQPYPILQTRFLHFEKEQSLVHQAVIAFERQLWSDVGNLLQASQHAADALLGNQVPETNFLAEAAIASGALAASAFGAGFGGAVWALLPKSDANPFMQQWSSAYQEVYLYHNSRFFITSPSAPAHYVV